MYLSIKGLRDNEVRKLKAIKEGESDFQKIRFLDCDHERYIMNIFYRLCGKRESLLNLENDIRLYTNCKRYIDDLNEQADRQEAKLRELLKPYGLKLTYFGYLPTITDFNNYQRIEKYFY